MESQSLVRIVKNRNRRASILLVLVSGALYCLLQTLLFRLESQSAIANLNLWLEANKSRLSKALYFNNQADLKTLIGELKAKKSQNERVLELKIYNKKGIELQSDLAKTLIPLSPTFPGKLWNGLINEDVELRFAGVKVGSVFVRSHYHHIKLLKHSFYALLICILLGSLLTAVVNRLLKTVDESVLEPLQAINTQLNAPLESVQSLNALSLEKKGANPIPREISQLVTEYNSQLEQIKDLNSSEIKLKENQAMERLADQVAHDIRSPLTALNLVVDELTLPDSVANIMKGSIARINEIANSLLNTRKTEIPSGGFSIVPILNQITTELKTRCRNDSKLSIDLIPHDGILETKIPSDRLSRIVSNLMTNSIEAMPDGGILSVQCQNEEGIPVITIADTGKGIPPEIIPQLGNYGYSFAKSEGNGLGLWSAKDCLKEFGGEIEISSALGKGTEIRLYV